MSQRARALLLACGALLLLAGATPLGLKLLREYQWRRGHTQYWKQVSLAFMGRRSAENMATGLGIPPELAPEYVVLEDALRQELLSRQRLIERSQHGQQLVEAAFKAITARDSEALDLLGPSLAKSKHELALAQKNWTKDAEALSKQIEALQQGWEEQRPGNTLRFALPMPQPAQRRRLTEAERTDAEQAVAWRSAQEQRLAGLLRREQANVAKGLRGPGPTPANNLVERYAAALALQRDVLASFEENVKALEADAQVDLSQVRLADIQPPKAPYLADKVEAELARLRLLSILSGMLNTCIETDGRETARAWQVQWPDHPLENAVGLLP